MSNKKLFSEIDRTLKKCIEGILNYDDTHARIDDAPSHQRERLEADLKKELKKLQKYRETIKQWINNDIIKDKSHLKSMRKQIEERMESFKKCEKETKTKAYSKEALRKAATTQKQSIKLTNDQMEAKDWFEMQMSELIEENEDKELEIEEYSSRGNKKYRNKINLKQQNEIDKINERIDRNKWHLRQLQICLDKVVNNDIDALLYKNISDDVEYYVNEAMDDDTYIHYDEMYHVITHFQNQSDDDEDEDEDEDDDDDDDDDDDCGVNDNEEEEEDDDDDDDVDVDEKNKNEDNNKNNDDDDDDDDDDDLDNNQINGNIVEKAKANDNNNNNNNEDNEDDDDDDDMMHIVTRKTNRNNEAIKNKKEQLQKKLKEKNKRSKQQKQHSSYDSISAQLLQEPLKPQQETTTTTTTKQRPNKPPILTNSTESDLAPFCRRLSDSERKILDIINDGYLKRPQPLDTHEPSFYKPNAPFLTPPYFPKERRKMFDNSHVFSLMELDTLFFIFYYQSQSYQQFMAAKELKVRGWSFNKRYSAWFQRHFSGNNSSNNNAQQQQVESINVDSETNLFKDEDKLSPIKQNLAKNEMKSLNGKGQHIIVDNKYERGTYIFFDRNQSWQMRMRENFKFDYQYLEDEQCVNVDDKIDWKRIATYGNGFGLIYGEQKKLMRYHKLQQRRSNSKQQQQQPQQSSRSTTRHHNNNHHPTRPPTQRFRPPIHHRQSRR